MNYSKETLLEIFDLGMFTRQLQLEGQHTDKSFDVLDAYLRKHMLKEMNLELKEVEKAIMFLFDLSEIKTFTYEFRNNGRGYQMDYTIDGYEYSIAVDYLKHVINGVKNNETPTIVDDWGFNYICDDITLEKLEDKCTVEIPF